MSRVPGMRREPKVVRTTCICSSCGELWVHFEAMPWDDAPDGPGVAFCIECGGELEVVE